MNNQGKVWGATSLVFAKNNVSLHRIEVMPGGYCSKHKHAHKFNMFFVEQGSLAILIWKNDYDLVDTTNLQSGQHTIIKPGEYHCFKNNSTIKAVVYEIYWTELDEGDILRESVGGMKKAVKAESKTVTKNIPQTKPPSVPKKAITVSKKTEPKVRKKNV